MQRTDRDKGDSEPAARRRFALGLAVPVLVVASAWGCGGGTTGTDAGAGSSSGGPLAGGAFISAPCTQASLGDGKSCVTGRRWRAAGSRASKSVGGSSASAYAPTGEACGDGGLGSTSWAVACCPPACGSGSRLDGQLPGQHGPPTRPRAKTAGLAHAVSGRRLVPHGPLLAADVDQ